MQKPFCDIRAILAESGANKAQSEAVFLEVSKVSLGFSPLLQQSFWHYQKNHQQVTHVIV
jgi:hypothetical protein